MLFRYPCTRECAGFVGGVLGAGAWGALVGRSLGVSPLPCPPPGPPTTNAFRANGYAMFPHQPGPRERRTKISQASQAFLHAPPSPATPPATPTSAPASAPGAAFLQTNKPLPTEKIQINIEEQIGCTRNIAGVVKDVTVCQSPRWMADSLTSAGMRPVNNLVDISNYVLLEMGHPTHIFDFGNFPTNTVQIKIAKKGEKFVTLEIGSAHV